ncbi:MAG: hypothetical protein H6737_20425 [Alphaproteobacteria bacterium]|nr:hypothetical protein [Alphaproteobacteria bacterium]
MDETTQATSGTEAVDVDVTPIPPLLWWSLFIPTFAVVVFGMQRLLAPRVPLKQVHDEE